MVLHQIIIDPDRYVTPLIPLLQLAIDENSFVNLRTFLPDRIHESDVMTIVRDLALSRLSSKDMGEIMIVQEEIFFITNAMTRYINRKIIPPLIESFAQSFAKNMCSQREHSKRITVSKRNAKELKTEEEKLSDDKILPLSIVISAVHNAYPDLSEMMHPVSFDSGNQPLSWEVENEDYISAISKEDAYGPLPELCRRIVYSASFCSNCHRAIEFEIQRLSRAVLSENDMAGKSSIESSWEIIFPQACHQLSLHYKFVMLVGSIKTMSPFELENIQLDFLRSNAACFASRITQFCLHQSGFEEQVIHCTTDRVDEFDMNEDYQSEDMSEDNEIVFGGAASTSTRYYTHAIPKAQRRFPKMTLKIMTGTNTDRKSVCVSELTTFFKEFLSPSLSKILAQMWALIGSSFENVLDTKDDLSPPLEEGCTTEDKIREFMAMVEEHCLSICGIPFSKWNKKSEKQYLTARKLEMTAALKKASNPLHILEWTIMILCQQLRNWVVSGPCLSGPILRILCQEKKLPQHVRDILQDLSQQVDQQTCDMELVSRVKSCGLCRDISKWTLEP
jgi:hypothetical protein